MMKNKNVMVIGDTILDETVVCSVIGTSLETPTMKVKSKSSSIDFGGASNVVEHLLELGAKVKYVVPIGADKYTEVYNNYLKLNV